MIYGRMSLEKKNVLGPNVFNVSTHIAESVSLYARALKCAVCTMGQGGYLPSSSCRETVLITPPPI